MSAVAAAAVRLRNVTHRYGKTLALDGVDLEIPAGGMVGLIGPDGVGKSTLLGLVTGARAIQTGSVEVLGGDIGERSFRSQVADRIAYMPQGLGKNLYPTLSVFENVDFFGRLFGHARAEREAKIDELLVATGLARFRERPELAKQLTTFGAASNSPQVDLPELAAYALAANVLLNLDEAVTRE